MARWNRQNLLSISLFVLVHFRNGIHLALVENFQYSFVEVVVVVVVVVLAALRHYHTTAFPHEYAGV